MFLSILEGIRSQENPRNEEKEDEVGVKVNNNEVPSHECHICGRILSSPRSLRFHITLIHLPRPPNERPFKCKICAARFATRSTKSRHVREVHQNTFKDSLESCWICKKTFGSVSLLNKHLRMGHKLKDDQLVKRPQCPICGKQFKYEKHVASHLRMFHNVRVTPHKCTLCPSEFTSLSARQNHVRQFHPNTVAGIDTFGSVGSLNKHLRVGHKLKDDQLVKQPQCPICGKQFKYDKRVASHLRMLHNVRITPHKCSLCPSEFTSLRAKQNHVRQVHPKPVARIDTSSQIPKRYNKTLGFEERKKRFQEKGEDAQETSVDKTRRLSTIFLFECKICDKTFPTLELLQNHDHDEVIHQNQENVLPSSSTTVNIAAHVSGESESSSSISKTSKKLDTESEPEETTNLVQCPYCPATFTDETICKKHRLRAHPTKKSQIPYSMLSW